MLTTDPRFRYLPESVKCQLNPQYRRDKERKSWDELLRLSPVARLVNDMSPQDRARSGVVKIGPNTGFMRPLTFRSAAQLFLWLSGPYARSHVVVGYASRRLELADILVSKEV